jgi:hypothetical protein
MFEIYPLAMITVDDISTVHGAPLLGAMVVVVVVVITPPPPPVFDIQLGNIVHVLPTHVTLSGPPTFTSEPLHLINTNEPGNTAVLSIPLVTKL